MTFAALPRSCVLFRLALIAASALTLSVIVLVVLLVCGTPMAQTFAVVVEPCCHSQLAVQVHQASQIVLERCLATYLADKVAVPAGIMFFSIMSAFVIAAVKT